jgi:hypothetical protein
MVGCSQNSLTTRNGRCLEEYPQAKRGSTHSRSDFFGHAESHAARIANQVTGGEVVVSSLVHDLLAPTGEFEFGRAARRRAQGHLGRAPDLDARARRRRLSRPREHAARSAREPLPLGRPGDDEAGVGAVDPDTPQRRLAPSSVLDPREEDAVALR